MSNGKHRQSVQRSLIVNTTEIAKMANVSVSTVSNWKRRSDTFPEPVGTKDGKPAFDYDQVAEWLQANNKEFNDNHTRNLVWEYANLVRGKVEVTEGMALFIALLHLRKAANEYGLETQWQTLIDGGDRGSWLSYLDAIDAVEHEAGHALSNHVVTYARGFVESVSVETIRDAVALVNAINLSKIMTAANMVIDAMGNGRQAYLGDNGSPLYRLMAEMANAWAKICPNPDPTFYDPACGGAFIAMQVALHDPQYRFALADINSLAAVIAQARFFLQFGKSATETIVLNDLVRNDPFPDLKCNLSVVTPPWGMAVNRSVDVSDRRWGYDVPRRNDSEVAFLQDCVAHLNDTGKAFVSVRPALAMMNHFAALRRRLIADGVVEAIVSLPHGQVKSTGISIDIWVLSKKQASDHVRIIDCATPNEEEVAPEGLPSYLADPLCDFTDGGHYRWVDVAVTDILADENAPLSAGSWIKPRGMNAQAISATSATEISTIRKSMEQMDDASNPLRILPDRLTDMQESRTLTLGELVGTGKAELIRGTTRMSRKDTEEVEGLITPENLSGDLFALAKASHVDSRDRLTEPGDVVFTMIGPIRTAIDSDGGHRLSSAVCALRMKDDAWLPEFVAICLRGTWNQNAMEGTPGTHVKPSAMKLPVVSLEMQSKLVEIQRAADELKHLSAAAADYATTFCNAIRFGAEEG